MLPIQHNYCHISPSNSKHKLHEQYLHWLQYYYCNYIRTHTDPWIILKCYIECHAVLCTSCNYYHPNSEKLEAPKNLRLEPRRYPNCNTTSYRFTWQQADGLDVNIFDYYEWTFNDYNSAKTSGRASYIYDVSELNPSSRYHFEVCAVDKCGQKGGCARIQNKEEVSCRREMNGDT